MRVRVRVWVEVRVPSERSERRGSPAPSVESSCHRRGPKVRKRA